MDLEKFKEKIVRNRIVSIEGIGGIGKTEFVIKCIDNCLGRDKIIWYECTKTSNIDSLIENAGFSYFLENTPKNDREKYLGFIDLLERENKILILDNYQDIEFDIFREFIEYANKHMHHSNIILISREHMNYMFLHPSSHLKINGLDKEIAVKYTKSLISEFYSKHKTITDIELEELCKKLEGHPLAIKLGLHLILYYGENLNDITQKIMETKDTGEELSKKLLEKVYYLNENEEEKLFLLKFSIFREKVEKDSLQQILEMENFDNVRNSLIKRLLISYSDGFYRTHPLIREFCYSNIDRAQKKLLHSKAAAFYMKEIEGNTEITKEDNIFYHILEAEDYELAKERVVEKGEKFIRLGYTKLLKNIIGELKENDIVENRFEFFLGSIEEIEGNWDKSIQYFRKVYEKEEVDNEIKVDSIIKYGQILHRKCDYKEALDFYGKALEISQYINYEKGIALSINNMGVLFDNKGEWDKALEKYGESLSISKKVGDKSGIALCLNNIGGVLSGKGEAGKALEKYEESLRISKDLGDKSGIALCLNNIGRVFSGKGEVDKALEKYEESLTINKDLGDKSGIAACLNNIGVVFSKKGELDKAFEKHEESLAIRKELGDRYGIALCLNNIGGVLSEKCGVDEALEKYEESLAISKELGDRYGISTCLNNIGGVLSEKCGVDKALEKYEESLAIRKGLGYRSGIAACLNNIGGVFSKKGELDKALEKYEESLAISKDIGDRYGIATCLNNIGGVISGKGEVVKALEKHEKSLAISKDIEYKSGIAISLNGIGKIFFNQANYGKTILYLLQEYSFSSLEEVKNNIDIVKKEIGLKKFREISYNTFHKLDENIKKYIDIDQFTKSNTIIKEESVGRNDICPCGSGKKYKKCCGK